MSAWENGAPTISITAYIRLVLVTRACAGSSASTAHRSLLAVSLLSFTPTFHPADNELQQEQQQQKIKKIKKGGQVVARK